MELSNKMRSPHNEVNEDGRVAYHPGYETRKCEICGHEFLCAVGSIATCCGDYKRDGLKYD